MLVVNPWGDWLGRSLFFITTTVFSSYFLMNISNIHCIDQFTAVDLAECLWLNQLNVM